MDRSFKAIMGTVLAPEGVYEDGVVLIEGDTIRSVGARACEELPPGCDVISEGGFVIPGLIDVHCHGTRLHDALAGTPQALMAMARAQARAGVTGFLPTVATASWPTMLKAVKAVGELVHTDTGGAQVLGSHVEGPFLSKDYPGAQSTDCFLEPSVERVQELIAAGSGSIRMMTLAPELPGALELIRFLRDQKIVPAMGHTGATYQQALAAVEAGCAYGIHSFNGMRSLDAREPATIGAGLADDRVTLELLSDCVHIHPAVMRFLIHGRENRICLATDLIQAREYLPGDYGAAYTGEAYLANNTAFLDQAVRNVVNFAGVPLPQAVSMATFVPASVIGLADRKGSLAPGMDADVVVLDDDYYPMLTLVAGDPVFQAVPRLG
ncbi:MAG: N-acetylglucosamine-6-phosphate deacetylase [Bacillota bacterium]